MVADTGIITTNELRVQHEERMFRLGRYAQHTRMSHKIQIVLARDAPVLPVLRAIVVIELAIVFPLVVLIVNRAALVTDPFPGSTRGTACRGPCARYNKPRNLVFPPQTHQYIGN